MRIRNKDTEFEKILIRKIKEKSERNQSGKKFQSEQKYKSEGKKESEKETTTPKKL